MAQSEAPVKDGNVTIGKGKSKKKKHYIKLFNPSETGLARLEIYDDEKSSVSGVPTDLIVGGDVVRIVPDAGSTRNEFTFAILTKEKNTYVIAVKASDIRNEWVKHIGSILFQAQPSNRISTTSISRKNTITDNDIYDSAEEYIRDFKVRVSDETCKRLSIQPCGVKLMVESGNITVIGPDGVLLGRWGIEHLRRFGYSDNDFHFEAGRKSELGPGLFSFKTDKGKAVHMTVTREKLEVRGNRVGTPGETEPPRIGAVQQDLMQFDPHCYEEINVVQKPIQKPNPGATPNKPSRGEMKKPQSPMTKAPPPGTAFHNNAAAGSQVYTEITPTTNAWKKHGIDVGDDDKEEEGIYEEGSNYDSLNRATLTNPQTDNYVDNTMYRADNAQEQAVSGIQRQMSEISVPNDAIYAEIDKSKKKNNR